MNNDEILFPLLEKGDIKQSIEMASFDNKKPFEVVSEGMNIVTASILADIPSVYKMDLIRKVGALFSTQEYCELLNQKMFTLRPEEREKLKDQGVLINKENILPYCQWFNIFEIAFPWLPLSVFEDFAIYLRDEKKLILDQETIETVRENFSTSKRYSERELSLLFDSNTLKDPADLDDEEA